MPPKKNTKKFAASAANSRRPVTTTSTTDKKEVEKHVSREEWIQGLITSHWGGDSELQLDEIDSFLQKLSIEQGVESTNGPEALPKFLRHIFRLDKPCLRTPQSHKMTNGTADDRLNPLCVKRIFKKQSVGTYVSNLMGDAPASNTHTTSKKKSAAGDNEASDEEGDSVPQQPPVGLRNLGATCYMNSIVQMLIHAPSMRQAVLQHSAPSPTDGSDSAGAGATTATNTLQDTGLPLLLVRLLCTREASITPDSFVRNLKIDTKIQQDAQEFLGLLLAMLDEAEKNSLAGRSPTTSTKIDAIYNGTLLYRRTCALCGHVSPKSEHFKFLSGPVMPTLRESIADVLKDWDPLQYQCEGCGDPQATHSTTVSIKRLPPRLIFHTMRFQWDMTSGQRVKVTDAMSLPACFPASIISGDPEDVRVYRLTAVVDHKGKSPTHGHYICHAEVPGEGWWTFDDADVKRAETYQKLMDTWRTSAAGSYTDPVDVDEDDEDNAKRESPNVVMSKAERRKLKNSGGPVTRSQAKAKQQQQKKSDQSINDRNELATKDVYLASYVLCDDEVAAKEAPPQQETRVVAARTVQKDLREMVAAEDEANVAKDKQRKESRVLLRNRIESWLNYAPDVFEPIEEAPDRPYLIPADWLRYDYATGFIFHDNPAYGLGHFKKCFTLPAMQAQQTDDVHPNTDGQQPKNLWTDLVNDHGALPPPEEDEAVAYKALSARAFNALLRSIMTPAEHAEADTRFIDSTNYDWAMTSEQGLCRVSGLEAIRKSITTSVVDRIDRAANAAAAATQHNQNYALKMEKMEIFKKFAPFLLAKEHRDNKSIFALNIKQTYKRFRQEFEEEQKKKAEEEAKSATTSAPASTATSPTKKTVKRLEDMALNKKTEEETVGEEKEENEGEGEAAPDWYGKTYPLLPAKWVKEWEAWATSEDPSVPAPSEEIDWGDLVTADGRPTFTVEDIRSGALGGPVAICLKPVALTNDGEDGAEQKKAESVDDEQDADDAPSQSTTRVEESSINCVYSPSHPLWAPGTPYRPPTFAIVLKEVALGGEAPARVLDPPPCEIQRKARLDEIETRRAFFENKSIKLSGVVRIGKKATQAKHPVICTVDMLYYGTTIGALRQAAGPLLREALKWPHEAFADSDINISTTGRANKVFLVDSEKTLKEYGITSETTELHFTLPEDAWQIAKIYSADSSTSTSAALNLKSNKRNAETSAAFEHSLLSAVHRSAGSPQDAGTGEGGAADPTIKECSVCTFHNAATATTCEMCGALL